MTIDWFEFLRNDIVIIIGIEVISVAPAIYQTVEIADLKATREAA